MKIPYFCILHPPGDPRGPGSRGGGYFPFFRETCGLAYSCSLHDNLCSYAKYLYEKILAPGQGLCLCGGAPQLRCHEEAPRAPSRLRAAGLLLDVPRRSGAAGAAYLAQQ